MTITFEEVQRCPACEQPGERRTGGRLGGAARGSSSILFYCRNGRCRWLDTPWLVEIMPDGTIHPPAKKRDKQYPALGAINAKMAIDSLQTLYEMTLAGAEIRR